MASDGLTPENTCKETMRNRDEKGNPGTGVFCARVAEHVKRQFSELGARV